MSDADRDDRAELTAHGGAKDPACGMRVSRGKAITKQVAGNTYHFCSEYCLYAFEVEQTYAEQRVARHQPRATHAH